MNIIPHGLALLRACAPQLYRLSVGAPVVFSVGTDTNENFVIFLKLFFTFFAMDFAILVLTFDALDECEVSIKMAAHLRALLERKSDAKTQWLPGRAIEQLNLMHPVNASAVSALHRFVWACVHNSLTFHLGMVEVFTLLSIA
jgi:hypothetical protein